MYKRSNAVSTVAPDDVCDTSADLIMISPTSPMSVEVMATKEELDASGFHPTCFVGSLNDPKDTARTMRKAQKKVVTHGVLDLHYHAALLSHCLGLSSFASSPDPDNVFLQDLCEQELVKVYDMRQNAQHLSQASDIADLCGGARICGALTRYHMDEHPMKVFHVYTTSTGRWHQRVTGEVVVLGENIGLTCNDKGLSGGFEVWSNDKTYEDVFSYHMSDWLDEISKEETLNGSMSVASPVQDETQDSQSTMDDLCGEEDEALADPVEVGIRADMDLVTVDILGLA